MDLKKVESIPFLVANSKRPPCLSRHVLASLGVRGDLSLKCLAQEGQVPVALDPVQARLDAEQRTGDPAVFLFGGSPPIDLVGVGPDLRQERLNAVGRLQADAQGAEQPQPVQRERLLEPLVEAL